MQNIIRVSNCLSQRLNNQLGEFHSEISHWKVLNLLTAAAPSADELQAVHLSVSARPVHESELSAE